MNIHRFIEIRKAKGYSQSDLADGICTQATLSRFENNGQVPNLKILNKLCNRIDFPLSDLFPKVGVRYSEVVEKMNQAEFFLITSKYEKAHQLISSIAIDTIEDAQLLLRYHYLNGFIMIFQHQPIMDILFTFDQVLLEEETADTTIFRLLAHTGIGMVYSREGDLRKAEFYFNKVLEKIYNYPNNDMEDTWRVLNIVYNSGVFYSRIDEIEISDALLWHAVNICSDNHVTYYLAKAAIQLAKNAIIKNEPKEKILELIYDARAYSKVNRNEIALTELADLERSVLETI
ncbi:DNA-binding transcriptional regulator, XRE-family HTH domain [Alkalibacterium putridalgicola]|uniref:Transcriptional regulator n=1 Tax=Alkalibacterium putridalgicola TaxID=426703 RepID=A0A1H7TX25_9LACT|nr:helix-turn-helix transcriptional regulator [Alkalibacterium putridalgicola]GEK88584.1 transcriptional regulator [Alkalibacterium putridalgicola]SEL89049.1 DNA-binding transcriptional regulator, XRE-family HTH domain [Alkalibacterium putridalgicola]